MLEFNLKDKADLFLEEDINNYFYMTKNKFGNLVNHIDKELVKLLIKSNLKITIKYLNGQLDYNFEILLPYYEGFLFKKDDIVLDLKYDTYYKVEGISSKSIKDGVKMYIVSSLNSYTSWNIDENNLKLKDELWDD